ncbi:lymphokine-activated killer T-cell-originated protein kinase-like [Pollicipes pollicipes]|uniref:lymphokine-activated killer T-cell-originated protein kinase-like n=1 Tax=Pollicipes pollicipes TaxID=41117 RepID=UPI00188493F3|nr:lymphokine-activated killer T-cell-originated protein kinase-like [Pollicipes pollicipes]
MFALEMPHASDLPDMSSDVSDLDDSDCSDSYFESQMGVPPPLPQYSVSVMTEYRPFVEIYAVCSAERAADRPPAAHCVELFRSLRPAPPAIDARTAGQSC